MEVVELYRDSLMGRMFAGEEGSGGRRGEEGEGRRMDHGDYVYG